MWQLVLLPTQPIGAGPLFNKEADHNRIFGKMKNAAKQTPGIVDSSKLLDLVRYDSQHHPFVDRHAHLSISFAGPSTVGPQALHPRSVLSTYEVVNPLLKLWSISSDGRWHSARRTALRSWPWAAQEEGELCGLSITTQTAFINERAVLLEIVAQNTQPSPVNSVFAWTGTGVPDRKLYMLDYFDGSLRKGRTLSVTSDEQAGTVVVTLRPEHGCDLPAVAVKIECKSPDVKAACSSMPAFCEGPYSVNGPFYAFRSPALSIKPGEIVRFTFRISVTLGESFQTRQSVTDDDITTLIEQRRASLTPVIITTNKTDWLVHRARLGLLRCGLRGLNGKFGSDVASLCTSDSSDFSCCFFWDSLFTSVALAKIDPELARGAIRTVFVGQLERDGSSPERKYNYCVPQRMAQQSPQSPIAAWAINQYLSQHDDLTFAGEMYPKIKANHYFWTQYSDTDRDGLAEYRWTGQVSDNSPLWDFYGLTDGKAAGCQWIPPVASVALNSFLYRDAIELAKLSTRLGSTDESVIWKAHADKIAENLMDVCFVEREKRFWDFNHHTQTHRRVRTFWMFWPLWAGIPIDSTIKQELIESVLLDKQQFFGAVPFPSVAYNEPTYNAAGYWRGKSWPHVSTWLVEILHREGYVTEAKIAAERLIYTWESMGAPTENLSTDPAQLHGGFSDYNWGCSAVIILNEYLSRGSI